MSRRKGGNEDPRGSAPRGAGLTARMQHGKAKDAAAQADWATVSPTVLQALVGVVTQTGAAILLGYSRDRGAYRVLVMDDDGKLPFWIPCTTDVDQALDDLAAEMWAALNDPT